MPLRRSEALQPLSRQHHNALLFCLLLRKGINKKADPEVMKEFIQSFWYKDLQHHFELEELYLLPLKYRYANLKNMLDRMVEDHYQLRNIVNAVSLNPTADIISELQAKLDVHIRFEEREMFPVMERVISEEERSAIGKLLQHEREHNCMNYSVRFWE